MLEYESISGDEMKLVIDGEPIVRIDLKPKSKRVRRRKKQAKEDTTIVDNTILTKPAT